MANGIDKIGRRPQEAAFKCYSQEFKEQLYNRANIGKIENADSHANIMGVCSSVYLLKMPLVYRRHVGRYTGLGVESGMS